MRGLVSIGASALLLLLSMGAQAALRASLDSTTISEGDTVQLTLERDGQTSDQPDLSPLQQDFDVVSTNRTSSIQIMNGSIVSHIQAIITLSPKHSGVLTVPAVEWAGDRSEPFPLTVTAGGAGSPNSTGGAAQARKVFVETSIDDADPFVQQAVHVTVRIYRAETVYKAGLDFPATSDALIEQIQSDAHRVIEKYGQQYDLVERRYLLFPQRSGTLKLAGPVLEGQVAIRIRNDRFNNDPFADLFGASGGMMAGTKPIRVEADPIVLNVRPRPANSGAGPWLPALDLKLTSEWHPDNLQAHVGDPITVDLQLQAEGLTATQLPDLSLLLELPSGIKAYPDQARLDNAVRGDTVVGTHKQSIALIADQPGDYVVPAMHLSWFDTKANEAREVNLPARKLSVLPPVGRSRAAAPSATVGGAATNEPPAAAAPVAPIPAPGAPQVSLPAGSGTAGTRLWIEISAGLAFVWMATLLAWWLSRRRAPGQAQPLSGAQEAMLGAAQARTRFHAACRRNDAPAARRALLAWVAAAWPEESLPGLDALGRRIEDAALAPRLVDLDRACYAGATWNGADLLQALKELPPRRARSSGSGDGLAPLYP
ncbi:MAG TPA: BatD family protein [Steroidobacteraceae bacterium]|nr:BatD family protein [Steroidobacteraceae bacterium]